MEQVKSFKGKIVDRNKTDFFFLAKKTRLLALLDLRNY